MHNRQNRHQVQKQNRLQNANERGIFAVRRKVSPASRLLLQKIVDELQPELHNVSRIFDIKSLGVTVIGFSRFDKRHLGAGPATKKITDRVDSCHQVIEVQLGTLGIYGSDTRGKLGISLTSRQLVDEVLALQDEFQSAGFPLKADPNSAGEYQPHCSLALLDTDKSGHFKDERALRMLNGLHIIESSMSETIVLDPVRVST